MATAIESEVRLILTSAREERINRSYSRAWSDWWENNERPRISRWPRTRATIYFEYLANRLSYEFSQDSGARFIFQRESFKLILEDRLVLRFKKANNNGVGSNIGTQAEMGFCEPQGDLPGLPGIQKVEIVYTLNVTGTALSEIVVQARNGDRTLWKYNIAASGGAMVVPLIQPQTPVPGADQMIVPRNTNVDENSQQGEV